MHAQRASHPFCAILRSCNRRGVSLAHVCTRGQLREEPAASIPSRCGGPTAAPGHGCHGDGPPMVPTLRPGPLAGRHGAAPAGRSVLPSSSRPADGRPGAPCASSSGHSAHGRKARAPTTCRHCAPLCWEMRCDGNPLWRLRCQCHCNVLM